MQVAYIKALYDIAKRDENVISVLADSGTEYDGLFSRDFPKQCINFGIAEEHMVAAAAGMASMGKIPFVYTTGAFLAYRAMEFVRDDVCFQRQNVKIVGMGSGLAWSTLGPTHHTTEDISVLRALPNLTIFSPATPKEVKLAVEDAYKITGPVYIRLGMKKEAELYEEDVPAPMKNNVCMKDGKDAVVFFTGSIGEEVMAASELLKKENIEIRVINVRSLKPIDLESILDNLYAYVYAITVEEHSIYGGLGGIIAEIMSEHDKMPVLMRIGIQDSFAKGYGTQYEVRKQNGLDAVSLAGRIRNFLQTER